MGMIQKKIIDLLKGISLDQIHRETLGVETPSLSQF
jgi:hypothetical protein